MCSVSLVCGLEKGVVFGSARHASAANGRISRLAPTSVKYGPIGIPNFGRGGQGIMCAVPPQEVVPDLVPIGDTNRIAPAYRGPIHGPDTSEVKPSGYLSFSGVKCPDACCRLKGTPVRQPERRAMHSNDDCIEDVARADALRVPRAATKCFAWSSSATLETQGLN
jgi:hypothetical protein